jgi:hypothetical protein
MKILKNPIIPSSRGFNFKMRSSSRGCWVKVRLRDDPQSSFSFIFVIWGPWDVIVCDTIDWKIFNQFQLYNEHVKGMVHRCMWMQFISQGKQKERHKMMVLNCGKMKAYVNGEWNSWKTKFRMKSERRWKWCFLFSFRWPLSSGTYHWASNIGCFFFSFH